MSVFCTFCEKSIGAGSTGFSVPEVYKESNRCCFCGRSVYTLDQIKIVGPFIIVEQVTPEVKTKGGIIFPSTLWRIWRVGRVAKLGEKDKYTCFRFSKSGKRLGRLRTFKRPDVEVGDIVLFQKQAPRGYDLGRGNIYFIHYEDVEIKVESENSILPM